jgi:hypothetical protein
LRLTVRQFVIEMTSSDLTGSKRGEVVKKALTDMLQELPAITTICYAGDSSEDIASFAARIVELYGDGAERIFGFIMEETHSVGPAKTAPRHTRSRLR